jgi:hypothetical protein
MRKRFPEVTAVRIDVAGQDFWKNFLFEGKARCRRFKNHFK